MIISKRASEAGSQVWCVWVLGGRGAVKREGGVGQWEQAQRVTGDASKREPQRKAARSGVCVGGGEGWTRGGGTGGE